jgi:hypothetical protein
MGRISKWLTAYLVGDPDVLEVPTPFIDKRQQGRTTQPKPVAIWQDI